LVLTMTVDQYVSIVESQKYYRICGQILLLMVSLSAWISFSLILNCSSCFLLAPLIFFVIYSGFGSHICCCSKPSWNVVAKCNESTARSRSSQTLFRGP
jgi:hypothetical protein